MRKIIAPTLYLCLLSLAACHKDPVKPPVAPTDSTTSIGTLKINLISGEGAWTDTTNPNVEMIISEPGGKVLLDTTTSNLAHIMTSLSTNATLVDVTCVYYDGSLQSYMATTYKGVNPSSWTTDSYYPYYYPIGPKPTTALLPDSLIFTNVTNTFPSPAYENVLFSQSGFSSIYLDYRDPDTTRVGYDMLPGNYAYLLYPQEGKYKMFIPTPGIQTVDCSSMDNVTSANYPSSSYYSYEFSYAFGYTDSTNLNSRIQLYINDFYTDSFYSNKLPNLEYPAKNIQKYATLGAFYHGSNEGGFVYSYGNTVNSNITYPDPNSYTITSNQLNHFSLNWNAAKPTYYYTEWVDSALTWIIFSSPDSTNINPLGILATQKPKMLQTQDLTKLNPYYFTYENVQGYNYADFLNLINDSTNLWKHPITATVSYNKYF